MNNYKMIVTYDGSKYSGWQKNKNAKTTIQSKIDDILSKYLGEDIQIIGAGRTDKGVHALAMATNFYTHKTLETRTALKELNSYLPHDISVVSIEKADEKFHARFNASSKTYRYTFYKGYTGYKPVFEYPYQSELRAPVSLSAMMEGSKLLLGKHDFKGFSSDKTKKSTERTIYSIDFKETENQMTIEFKGDGFLYNMIRILVGTLVEIGLGTKQQDCIDQVFSSGVREHAGFLAEAKGLSLVEVFYDK